MVKLDRTAEQWIDVVFEPLSFESDSDNDNERPIAGLVAAAVRQRAEGEHRNLHEGEVVTRAEEITRLGEAEHIRALAMTLADLEGGIREDLEAGHAFVLVSWDGDQYRSWVTLGIGR